MSNLASPPKIDRSVYMSTCVPAMSDISPNRNAEQIEKICAAQYEKNLKPVKTSLPMKALPVNPIKPNVCIIACEIGGNGKSKDQCIAECSK